MHRNNEKREREHPPTHQAAIDRLKKEGQVKWKGTTGVESRALWALEKKNIVRKVFQPYGNTYFELNVADAGGSNA